jgi:uncharacterized protein with PIN domain
MIVDTSALIAILFTEEDAELYARAIAGSEHAFDLRSQADACVCVVACCRDVIH